MHNAQPYRVQQQFEGEDKDIVRDAMFSGAAGAAGGGANHAGEKINDSGGAHRATGREGFPGWQQIPVDGIIYGAGNAANTELSSSD